LGFELKVVFFRDGQGVHVRPKGHGAERALNVQDADDTRRCDVRVHLKAQLFQFPGNRAGGADFGKAGFRVFVEDPPHPNRIIVYASGVG